MLKSRSFFVNISKYRIRKENLAFLSNQPVIAIRREDGNLWERRAPLTPTHVQSLVNNGVKVLVQPANKRAFPVQEYANAGAEITENLSNASVILGVKQVPIESLIPDKTYVFFSHTIKAQAENMQLLDAILEKNIRLIDYEKMEKADGTRVVAFSKYAGYAGMVDILHGIGLRLLALGHHTPFMHIGIAHNYRTAGQAIQAVRDAGYEISLDRMPASIGPLVFVFTGTGAVSQGAQEVFKELPCIFIEPQDLRFVAEHGDTRVIYGCVVSPHHHLRRKNDSGFNFEEYLEKPHLYESVFAKEIAPYASCIINGIFWRPNDPRLLETEDGPLLLKNGVPKVSPLIRRNASEPVAGCPKLPQRLIAICDISADPGGSIEFTNDCTTIDAPFEVYNPDVECGVSSDDVNDSEKRQHIKGDGFLLCSIANLPAQLPRESSQFFGDLLMPYMNEIIRNDAKIPFEDTNHIDPVVRNAVIASNGHLTPKYDYITEMRERREKEGAMMTDASDKHKVLVLGAGYVSHPVIDYVTRYNDTVVTVASAIPDEVDKMSSRNFRNTSPVLLDVLKEKERLEDLIKGHDVVVSLLPYTMHYDIAEVCVEHKKHFVTASYVCKPIQGLHQKAMDAGVKIVMEMGVDPGVDHMLAMKSFDDIKDAGGKIKSFISFCGGLPAPEDSGNPLRYKFSWSPEGVLRVVLAATKYLSNNQIVERPAGKSYQMGIMPVDFMPAFNLEGLPNRDSVQYKDQYGLKDAHTVIRGTLRYKGYTDMICALQNLGLIDVNDHPLLQTNKQLTWNNFMMGLTGTSTLKELSNKVLEAAKDDENILEGLKSLGVLGDTLVGNKQTPISALAELLEKNLSYQPGERDLVLMRHEIVGELPDGKTVKHDIDLALYGESDGGYTAMAKGVGYPCGVATRMVLLNEIEDNGVVIPLQKSVYSPILKRLNKLGIVPKTKISKI